jgi:hypothetical protein
MLRKQRLVLGIALTVLSADGLSACGAGTVGGGQQQRADAGPSSTPEGGQASDGGSTGGDAQMTGGGGGDGVGEDAATPGHTDDAGAGGDDGDAGIPSSYVPGLVAAGYGGMIVSSRDDGLHCTKAKFVSGGSNDDDELLRAVAWGKGVWLVGGGKRLFRSLDGVHWELRPLPMNRCMEAIAYGNGKFVSACNERTLISSDGLTWKVGGSIGSLGKHNVLQFGAGKFVATGDGRATFTSSDGVSWTALSGVDYGRFCEGQIRNEADCHSASWLDGLWFKSIWQGKIGRSTTGREPYSVVYTDADGNSVFTSYTFAAGMLAPL